MHVLYLHQYFVPPDGAGGTRSYEMARRFVRAGHKVTLVTSSAFFPDHYRFDRRVTALDIEGIRIHVVRVPYSNRYGFLRRVAAFLWFALAATVLAVRIERPDVIFATSTPLTIAIPGIAARLRHRRPMVFEVRDLWPELPIAIGALRNPLAKALARLLERAAYRSSDSVIALSPGMRAGVCRTGMAAESVHVIPNGCDVESFGRAHHAVPFQFPAPMEGGSIVLYAGTLGAINGVEYLVHVAAAMREVAPSVRFAIVGDGAMRERIVKLAQATGVLGTNLWILAPVSKSAMPSLLQQAAVATSLFVDIPEMRNNSANKFFDALAAGTPVAINYGGWHAELLSSTGAGVVLPPRDPAAGAEQLAALLRDAERMRLAREAARELAMTRFDRDILAAQLRRILEEVADAHRAPAARPDVSVGGGG